MLVNQDGMLLLKKQTLKIYILNESIYMKITPLGYLLIQNAIG